MEGHPKQQESFRRIQVLTPSASFVAEISAIDHLTQQLLMRWLAEMLECAQH